MGGVLVAVGLAIAILPSLLYYGGLGMVRLHFDLYLATVALGVLIAIFGVSVVLKTYRSES
jgi:hypothetical protein